MREKDEIAGTHVLAVAPEFVISRVCDCFGVDAAEIKRTRPGRENRPRDVAIYRVRRYGHKTLAEVGADFGISNYCTVSSAIGRVTTGMANDKSFAKKLAGIVWQLNKGQRQI